MTNRIEQANRTALTHLVSDIVNLPVFDTREKQTIAFSCIFTRLFKVDNDITYITAMAAGGLNKPKTDFAIYIEATRVNALIHNFRDVDGDLVFNQSTGILSEKWQSDMSSVAVALEKSMPDTFLPTKEPTNLRFPRHTTGVQLINTNKKFAWQTPKDMPKAYEALNALQSEGYILSMDMRTLRNLPIALDIGKNYAARQIMLNNMEAFQDEIFFRYTLDYRGRAYARSIIINPQGDSFSKACLESSVSKPLGKYGLGALAIHFANTSGQDKLSFNERILWARTEGIVKASFFVQAGGDWRKIEPYIDDPKHAFEEYCAGMEYYRAWHSGDKENYESRLMLHQDATNSGFQFGAALTGDRATASLVNITPDLTSKDAPADLYGVMAKHLTDYIVEQDQTLTDWLPAIDRNFCKKPIMTTGYGAGITTIMTGSENKKGSQGILQYMEKLIAVKPELRHLVERVEELKPAIEYALGKTASAMLTITETMHQHAKDIVDLGSETIEWTTPDGFVCIQQKRDNQGRRIELANGATTFEKLKRGSKDPIDSEGMTRALPPNFIHSMDAQMLRTAGLAAKAAGIAFVPIHDSFGTHAATFFELNTVLRESFVDTMSYDWYGSFCDHNNVQPDLSILGDYEHTEALRAIYMFS